MQGGEWTSWEPQPVSRPGHWLEAGPLSSEQRADLSLEIPREAAASSLDGTESVPGPARHFLILFLVFFPLVLSSLQQGMGAVWCSASWEDFQRTTGDVLWDGLPPQKGAGQLGPSLPPAVNRRLLLKTSVQGRGLSFHSQPLPRGPLIVLCIQ